MRKLRIAELRKEYGYTLKELGEKLGVRDNTLSQYETGKRQPQLGFLYELADFFHVSLDYLTGESELRNFTLNTEEEFINLLEMVADNKIGIENFNVNTALKLGNWSIENMEFLEEKHPHLVTAAIRILSAAPIHFRELEKYSDSRKKEYELIEKIHLKITSDDYSGAKPDEILEFIKESERVGFKGIKKVLNIMKELPDRTNEI